MIEMLSDMPAGVTGVRVSGRRTVWPHHAHFKRIAVVSDKEWVNDTVHALAWMIPGELKTFQLAELDGAKEWAAG